MRTQIPMPRRFEGSAGMRAEVGTPVFAEGGTMIVPQPVYPEQPYPEGGAMYEVLCGGWELVASFAEEVAAIAEPLRLSDHRRDQRIATMVRPTLLSKWWLRTA